MKNQKITVETFKIKKWKDLVTGLVISENNDWVLVQNIPSDYALDGYTVYKKKYIKDRFVEFDEKLKAKVLKLRDTEVSKPKGFEFGDTFQLLEWVEKNYGMIEFQDYDQTALFYGKINKRKKDKLTIDFILSDGTVEQDYDHKISLSKFRSISFGSDYFGAVKLLMEDKMKK